ncbi:MAG: hypothetical protein AAFU55_07740, partial [Pseudomonadota bacterium]
AGGDKVRIDALDAELGDNVAATFDYTISDGELTATATANVTFDLTQRALIGDGVQGTELFNAGSNPEIIGDVNGDGIADFIFANNGASRYYNDDGYYTYATNIGEAYVVFGASDGLPDLIDPDGLDGTNGFVVSGADNFDELGSNFTGVGDFNGDGVDDFLVSDRAQFENYAEGFLTKSYLIFGTDEGFPEDLSAAEIDGTNGIVIAGPRTSDFAFSELAISSAGDLNGDGFDDLIVSSGDAYVTVNVYNYETQEFDTEYRAAGGAFVVFGTDDPIGDLGLYQGAGNPAAAFYVNDVDASTGVFISAPNGVNPPYASVGRAIAAVGDVNGDGVDDIAVNSGNVRDFDYGTYGQVTGDQVHIIFGSTTGLPASIDLSTLDGTNGFTVTGGVDDFLFGQRVEAAGDFNGDGFDDVAFTSPYGAAEGSIVVLLGRDEDVTPFASGFSANQLDGTNGLRITTPSGDRAFGFDVASVGDLNDDGFDDLAISSSYGGVSFVVYGTDSGAPIISVGDIDGTNGFLIAPVNDYGYRTEVAGGADLNGDGVEDIIVSGGPAFILNGGVDSALTPAVGVGSYEFSEFRITAGNEYRVDGALNVSDIAGPVDFTTDDFRVGGNDTEGRIVITSAGDPVRITVENADNIGDAGVIAVGADRGGFGELFVENGAQLISRNNGVYDPDAGFVRGGYYNVNIGRN